MLIAVGVVTAVGLVLLLLWYGSNVLLLIFAGLLLSVFLCSLSDWVSQHTPLSNDWALAAVVGLLALAALAGWFFAPSVTEQVQQRNFLLLGIVAHTCSYVKVVKKGAVMIRRTFN